MWNPATRPIVYNGYVIIKEAGRTSKTEDVREKKLKRFEFN